MTDSITQHDQPPAAAAGPLGGDPNLNPVDPAQNETEDAALSRIFGEEVMAEDGDEPEAPAEEPTTGDEEPQEAPAEEEATETPDEPDDELEVAYGVLAKAGIKKAERDGMSREQVLSIAATQRKIQDDIKSKLDERSQLLEKVKQLEESRAEPGSERTTPPGQPDVATLQAAAKPLADALQAEFADEKLGQAVSEAMVEFGQVVAKHTLEQVPASGDEVQTLIGGFRDLVGEMARTRFADRTAELGVSDEGWQKVADKATTLIRTGDYEAGVGGIYDAYDDAITLLHGKQEVNRGREQRQVKRSAKRNGQVTTTAPRSLPEKDLSPSQEADRVLMELDAKYGLGA